MEYRSAREYIESLKRDINRLGKAVEAEEAKGLAQDIDRATKNNVEVKQSKGTVEVTQTQQNSQKMMIDLKEGFKRGKSARPRKGGGWYTVIPIRRYTNKPGTRGMNNRMYEQLRRTKTTQRSQTIISDYLYDRRIPNSTDSLIDYTPTSDNITKIENKRGRGSRYVAFRTVSDRSDPASWIVNRASATDKENREVAKIVEDIIRFRELR